MHVHPRWDTQREYAWCNRFDLSIAVPSIALRFDGIKLDAKTPDKTKNTYDNRVLKLYLRNKI